VESSDSIQLKYKGELILNYQIAELEPPSGVDSAYSKNGFIHPLNSPTGHALTGIHPEDHYHHTGLWHAWVKTKYITHNPDFWNLKNIQLSRENKKVKSTPAQVKCVKVKTLHTNGFTVVLHHHAFLNGVMEKPTVILKEELRISLNVVKGDFIIDYGMIQENIASEVLELPSYRYGGGVAYRGPLHWNVDNSDYLSSEGLDRTNSHTSKAKWVAMFGTTGPDEKDYHGLAIFCHPKNFNAPQHIRTWGNGKMFFNYVPTQSASYEIKPGQKVTFNYRIVAYAGLPDQSQLNKQYQMYLEK
jgi:hypothetical protein